MNSSDPAPRIPLWVFFATDFALLAAAAFIAADSPRPLDTSAILGIVACVITGAGVALIPLVLWFERQKNETLDERQRALEALATTVSNSAEQVGIATAGLQQIAEMVQKNVRHAEQLPHRLQEKIAEFQAQLANATEGEKEELEKEVAALRGTETERLESISDRLTRAVAEFTKLEAATHHHLSSANEALGKLALGTAGAIGKAQAAAEQALTHARVEAARHLGETTGQNLRALEAAKAAALSEFEAKAGAAASRIAERISHGLAAQIAPALSRLDEKIARLEAAAHQPQPATVPHSPASTIAPPATEAAATATPDASTPGGASSGDHPEAAAPRRPRRPRRDEEALEVQPRLPSAPSPSDEYAAVRVHPVATEVMPVAPATAEPFAANASAPDSQAANGGGGHASSESVSGKRATGSAPMPNGVSPTRHRRRPAEPLEELLPTAAPEESAPSSGVVERVLTSDGATRLIVTAYIGIGNRLFIRGEGAGLSWEKGVPLQFISIGKWRWESNDATDSIRFKLLKNDEQECSALGTQTLDPGHQQEVTAAF